MSTRVVPIAFIIGAFIISFTLICRAQTADMSGHFSLSGDVGYNIPISSSMRATWQNFRSDVLFDAKPNHYPFGDDRTQSFSFGGQFAYRFPESDYSLLTSVHHTWFVTLPADTTSEEGRLRLTSWSVGGEFTLGTPTETLNAFGRLGANVNWMTGRAIVSVFGLPYVVNVNQTVRVGAEVELGGRYNFLFAPLALEVSANYTYANLIGKSFTPSSIGEAPTELNDGKDPEDAEDRPRAIDFLSLRTGIRIWF